MTWKRKSSERPGEGDRAGEPQGHRREPGSEGRGSQSCRPREANEPARGFCSLSSIVLGQILRVTIAASRSRGQGVFTGR
jgi:hypothetical protein